MISTMKKNKTIKKAIRFIFVLTFWLAVWETASLLVNNDLKLFLPSPFKVLEKWFEIGFTREYLICSGATLLRIFSGFISGITVGFALGLLTSNFKFAEAVFSPVMKIVRTVPVVSFIILAFLFIRVDNLPVFISYLMVVPLMWQTVHDGIKNSDNKLDEMCKVFHIGKAKSLFIIKIPQCRQEIITAAVNSLGYAWKSGVAAEVLCAPAVSLGHKIISAKNSLDYDEVYAVTLTVVILSIVFEIFFKFICRKYISKEVRRK